MKTAGYQHQMLGWGEPSLHKSLLPPQLIIEVTAAHMASSIQLKVHIYLSLRDPRPGFF